MDPTKPGVKTSEFYGKVLTQALILGLGYFHKGVDPQTASLIVAGLEGIYVLGRSLVKASANIKSVTPPAS